MLRVRATPAGAGPCAVCRGRPRVSSRLRGSRVPRQCAAQDAHRMDIQTLAREILDKENKLQSAFRSGYSLPSGKQVAQMRASLKSLRSALAARLEQEGRSGAEDWGSKDVSAVVTSVAAQRARDSMQSVQARMALGADAVGRPEAGMSEQEVLQLEVLRMENDDLRKTATGLLMRQHELEELMAASGLLGGQSSASSAAASPQVTRSQQDGSAVTYSSAQLATGLPANHPMAAHARTKPPARTQGAGRRQQASPVVLKGGLTSGAL